MGIGRVVVNAWHLADKLMEHVGDGGQWGVEVVWSREQRLLNTGGGVRNALDKLGGAPVLLVNGDILWDLDLSPLIKEFSVDGMDAVLGLIPNPPYKKNGDFICPETGGVLARCPGQEEGYTYSGIMMFNPQALADYPMEPFSLNVFFDDAIKAGRIRGLPLVGSWADMGTPERLAKVQMEWKS